MKIAIMQPYFFPYIGYFQLINAVDTFVIYDDIKYTKKGWINRNNLSDNIKITIPIKKASNTLDIRERKLSDDWHQQKKKIINKVNNKYISENYYSEVNKIFSTVINYESLNLFDFIYNSIKQINSYLGIKTKIVISSELNRDRKLKCQDSVLQICRILKAKQYINPIGGQDLYDHKYFKSNSIKLNFIKMNKLDVSNDYVSILDLLFKYDRPHLKNQLNKYIMI